MEKSAETITVSELDKLCEAIAKKESEIEKQEEVVTELNKELIKLQGRAVNYLKDLKRSKYDSPFGKATIEEKWRVNLPETDKDKRDLFDHLRERGIFDKYATVNSNSLNSLYMADWNAAKEKDATAGMLFQMPGIGAPQLFEKLKFKAAKK